MSPAIPEFVSRASPAKRPLSWALAAIVLFWGVVLVGSGALFAGFHFIDDHEQMRMESDLRAPGASLGQVVQTWVARDLKVRFRPLYYVHRVLLVKLIGTNWVLWELHQALLAVLTSLLLFAFCRRMGWAWTESILFPLLALVGPQAAIYWRLGPQEALGMLFLAAALYGMARAETAPRRRAGYEALGLIAAALAALCKESFILVLPALAFWRVWLAEAAEPPDASPPLGWWGALRRARLSVAVLLLVCAGGLFVVVSRVGTENTGYAGVEGTGPGGALLCLWRGFSHYELYTLALGLAALFAANFAARRRVGPSLIPALALFLLLLLPQGMLYAKSGIYERYHLPAAVGLAFFLGWVYRALRRRNSWLALAFLVVLLANAGWHARREFRHAQEWRAAGRSIQAFLTALERLSDERSTLLVVADPAFNNEEALSLKSYLSAKGIRRTLYVYPVWAPPYTAFDRALIKRDDFTVWFEGRVARQRTPPPRVDLIVLLTDADGPFLHASNRPPWFQAEGWERMPFGGGHDFVIYRPAEPARSAN